MNRTEEREQARLIKWSTQRNPRAIAPELAGLFHVPNGGKRDAFTGAQMLALGVKRGVPDLLLPFPSQGFTGLALEMKSEDGALSPDQAKWRDLLTGWGWCWCLCRSAEEARAELARYLDRPALLQVPL